MQAVKLQCDRFLDILKLYSRAAGQTINFVKFSIFFNSNVSSSLRESLKAKLNISNTLADSSYLGLPLIIRQKKAEPFEFLLDRIKNKVANWKGKLLSKTGKENLINLVLQATPIYAMSLFKLPKGFCESLESYCAKFFFGEQRMER
ncbi:uncharacterized protein [Rutidosis leptorrhynchoides]|uniref:uncharacterized protein n=1 Tax=Rutidosis leptorrhynchoides TaxID=125765 RepID=UPI003A99CEBE